MPTVQHGNGKPARSRVRWAAGLALAVTVGSAAAGAAGTGAGAAPTSPSGGRTAAGSALRLPAGARLLGPVPRSAVLQVTVALRPRDPAGLARLAAQVSTPSAAAYRRFLDPAEIQARFGPRPAVLSALRSWLAGHGLRVRPVLGDGLLVPVTGPARQLEAAFSTPIRLVRLAGGRIAHANTRPPAVPAGLRSQVAVVAGLDNLVLAQPYLAPVPPAAAPVSELATARPATARPAAAGPRRCAAASDTPDAFTASQLAYAYGFTSLYRRGDLGQGVSVALYELADYANSDIRTYERCYRIRPSVQRVPVDGGTTISADPLGTEEATADIETLTGMAPRVHVLVYEAPASLGFNAVLDNYGAIAQQDRAQVVSSSWGYCEPLVDSDGDGANISQSEASVFEEMAAQGQSMLAASGDAGSEQCLPFLADLHAQAYQLAVADPASQPDVTAVGGTAITRLGSPPAESAWNQSGPGGDGSGFTAPFDGQAGRPDGYPGNVVGSGGISVSWPMPSWQRGFDTSGLSSGVPCGAPARTDCREVPDVSALAAAQSRATPGYAIYGTAGGFDGSGWLSAGGTSLASPLWAAVAALADQQARGHRLGLLSPALYRIARLDPAAFTDVTTGSIDYLAAGSTPSNDTCTYASRYGRPCYEATAGYDMATGLGSPDARILVAQLDPHR